MKKEDYISALSFLTISFQFFSLVQNSVAEIVKSENKWIILSPTETPIDEYLEQTTWSDHQVIIPILFNFYHGLELFLKGLMQFDSDFTLKAKHSIEGLGAEFIKNNPEEKVLCYFLKKYTHLGKLPTILKAFLDDNKLTVNKLYESLRYPTDSTFTDIRGYLALKYQDNESIPFFEELIDDINNARQSAVEYGRSFK